MNNIQRHRENTFLRNLQVLTYSFNFPLFYRTRGFITIFTTAWLTTLSPNFFSPLIFCCHIYFSLNNNTIEAHKFSALQTPCWQTKMRDKTSETLKNNRTPKLTNWSSIGTNNIRWTSILKHHQPYPKLHTLNFNNQWKKLLKDEKT